MLIQLLADITRDKKVIKQLLDSPDKVLKKYPGITKKQAQLLKKRDINALSEAASQEVAKHFSQKRYSLMYFALSMKFESITPDSHAANDKVALTMVLKLNQSPVLPDDLASSVVFTRRSDQVKAKVCSTVYNKRKSTITIEMSAKFPTGGSYSAQVDVWDVENPSEKVSCPTGNIFKATA